MRVAVPQRSRAPLVSVVATAFNEERNLRELYKRVRAALESAGGTFELVIVDNGSTDGTLAVLQELRAQDSRVAWVSLSRNFGHQGGLLAALDFSAGDVVVSMDADLQHPPETIPLLLARWREGYDVVHAVERQDPRKRSVHGRLRNVFYRLFDRLSGLDLHSAPADFRLFDGRVAETLCRLPERQKFIRGLVRWLGFRQTAVEYDLAPRLQGESKFRYRDLFALAVDALLAFSMTPLRLLALAGMLLAVPALAYSLFVIVLGIHAVITGDHRALPPGWATIVAAIHSCPNYG